MGLSFTTYNACFTKRNCIERVCPIIVHQKYVVVISIHFEPTRCTKCKSLKYWIEMTMFPAWCLGNMSFYRSIHHKLIQKLFVIVWIVKLKEIFRTSMWTSSQKTETD